MEENDEGGDFALGKAQVPAILESFHDGGLGRRPRVCHRRKRKSLFAFFIRSAPYAVLRFGFVTDATCPDAPLLHNSPPDPPLLHLSSNPEQGFHRTSETCTLISPTSSWSPWRSGSGVAGLARRSSHSILSLLWAGLLEPPPRRCMSWFTRLRLRVDVSRRDSRRRCSEGEASWRFVMNIHFVENPLRSAQPW